MVLLLQSQSIQIFNQLIFKDDFIKPHLYSGVFFIYYFKKNTMKLKLYAEETFTTTLTRERVIIDTDNYPELEGMDEDQISDYIDNNVWEMKPTEDGIYSSLGEELSDQSSYDEHIGSEETTFYVEQV